jgi:hypothetical protein
MSTGLEIVGGKIFDLILSETFGGAIGRLMENRARMAREEIVKQLEKGKHWAITDDDAAAAIFSYLRAAQEGAARVNLRMMAEALFNAAQESTFEPVEFRRHASALASLSRDEVLLLAAFLHTKRAIPMPAPSDAEGMRRAADHVWISILGDAAQFPEGFEILGVVAALTRTGWVIPVSSVGQINYFTTSDFDRVARLVDFEVVRLYLDSKRHNP